MSQNVPFLSPSFGKILVALPHRYSFERMFNLMESKNILELPFPHFLKES